MTATEFREWLRQVEACTDGWSWARGRSPQEAWEECSRGDWMLWLLDVLWYDDDSELRLFACWCVRQVWDKLTDPRSRRAVEVAERYARGEATKQELEDARGDACAVAAAAAATDCEDHAICAALDTTDPDAWCAANTAATCSAKAARTVSPSGDIEARAAQADELRRRIPWTTIEPLLHKAAGGGAQ